jgi:2-oxoglutarate dehydrogenase complex dehydrogenase (E1) component-like enzyme
LQAREEKGASHVALVRLEQLYPFAQDQVQAVLAKYSSAELLWVQEEPRNMGSWHHIEQNMRPLIEGKRLLRYVGRLESASPSAGSAKRHQQEQNEVIEEAFAAGPLPKKARPRRKR